jgi:hypothetical protein
VSENSSISWFEEFLGIAYRYFDVRMNIVLMFSERKPASTLWFDTIHAWNDHTIKIRFVETGDDYWFVMGADSRKPETNKYFYKILPKSEHYERFKKGHQGSAYLRFGIYKEKFMNEVKNADVCNCGHRKDDHHEEDTDCLYEVCDCKKFASFQLNYFKKKKVVTDMQFITEDEVKDDALAWNCLNRHKYSKPE